jgi:PBP1b-binding outer membrane lipoprotein LpoB
MKNIVSQLVLFISAFFLIGCSGGQDVPDQSQDEPTTTSTEGEDPEEEEK